MTKLNWEKANRQDRQEHRNFSGKGTKRQRELVKKLTKELNMTRHQKEALWRRIYSVQSAFEVIDELIAAKRPEAAHMAAIRREGEAA